MLASPSSTHGTRYLYNLAYQSPAGTIAPQRFVVNQASLATENARYYSADTSDGYLSNFPAFPVNPGTGVPAWRARAEDERAIVITLHHGERAPSGVWLPVIPDDLTSPM